MPCEAEVLKSVPLFSLLDEEERAVLAAHVEMRSFSARERIYKIGSPGGKAYILLDGRARVTTVDEEGQEVIVDEPASGEFFGFASMLDGTPHQTGAMAVEDSRCIEVDRDDLAALLQRKPLAGMDMLSVLGRHFHQAHQLVRVRSLRSPNEIIEGKARLRDRIADSVARFGGSWAFITSFGAFMVGYTMLNVRLAGRAWDPYPFILLNLFLSMLAAIQAPVIMMSQNRQDQKDRLRSELDFEVNRRSEAEIQGLAQKLNLLGEMIGDVEDLIRARLPKAERH